MIMSKNNEAFELDIRFLEMIYVKPKAQKPHALINDTELDI